MTKGIYFEIDQASVNNTNLETVLTFVINGPSPVRIVDLSLTPDSTFAGSGEFNLIIGGLTSSSGSQKLPNSLDVPFWALSDKGLVLLPGEKIEILASCSSGTGLLTVNVMGEVI